MLEITVITNKNRGNIRHKWMPGSWRFPLYENIEGDKKKLAGVLYDKSYE